MISPAVGSFLGVLVDRLPHGQNVTTRPSTCTNCAARLHWRDMIPLVPALALQGKCRHCGAPFPSHLIRIEIAAVLAALLCVALVPSPMILVLTAVFLWLLITLFYCDLHAFRLPDPLTLFLFIIGMGLAVFDPQRGVFGGLLSAMIASGAFLLIRWAYFALRAREGLGLGDVKLMAGIGAALGWPELPLVTLIAAALALAVVALELLRGRRLKENAPLPFGSYLCVSAALLVFL